MGKPTLSVRYMWRVQRDQIRRSRLGRMHRLGTLAVYCPAEMARPVEASHYSVTDSDLKRRGSEGDPNEARDRWTSTER